MLFWSLILQPDVVVVNAGNASFATNELGPVTMRKEDVEKVHNLLPDATIIVIHMEAVNHCILSRKELREFVSEKGIHDKVVIPEEGQSISL